MGARRADVLAGLVFGMISVVVPTFNEEKALPGTLQALFAQPGEYEVIVAHGGSTDRTRKIVDGVAPTPQHSALGTVRFLTAPKGRASQMNAGAAQASGAWLLFLHADTILPDGAIR